MVWCVPLIASFIQHNYFRILPWLLQSCFIPLYCWVVFHYMDMIYLWVRLSIHLFFFKFFYFLSNHYSTESTENIHSLVSIYSVSWQHVTQVTTSNSCHIITGREKKLPNSLTNFTWSLWILLLLYTIKLHIY